MSAFGSAREDLKASEEPALRSPPIAAGSVASCSPLYSTLASLGKRGSMSSSNSLRPADSDSDQIVSTPQGDVALLTLRPLKVEEVLASVGDKGVGGTAVFVGTTRDHFNGARFFSVEGLIPGMA